MDPTILIALTLAIVGYIAGSVKTINEGTKGIVERFGQYRRTLDPGLNFVIPLIDKVVFASTREQLLDIPPQSAITRDKVSITVDAILYWRILDVRKAYYAIEHEQLDAALSNLVITTMRSEIGRMDLPDTFSSRDKINQALLYELDEATETWGVKVTRVEVQEIKLSDAIREALEAERAAESRKKAVLFETEGTVKSIQQLADAIQSKSNADAVLRYLIMKHYVDSNQKLSESPNSKIIFMDPKALSETVGEIIAADTSSEGPPQSGAGGNGKHT